MTLDEYILQHIDEEGDYLKALYRDTHLKLLYPRMASGHLQGRMLKMFVRMIQNTLQAQAAHAVNLALTSRNWLMGCYIVEFEQNGEDRAAYGEQLLKKLEQRLKTKA